MNFNEAVFEMVEGNDVGHPAEPHNTFTIVGEIMTRFCTVRTLHISTMKVASFRGPMRDGWVVSE